MQTNPLFFQGDYLVNALKKFNFVSQNPEYNHRSN